MTSSTAILFALTTPGGIVSLPTGQMRAHDRAAMMTKITAVAPEGNCPQWLAFEDEVTGKNVEYRDFLRAFAGYSLTAACEEELDDPAEDWPRE